jgi:acyl dehydratase
MNSSTTAATALSARIGQEMGASPWLQITQSQVTLFADAVHDWQFIHVDAQRAALESPYGGTIAHGFLSLSLLTALSKGVLPQFTPSIEVNYGFDKVRFITPVKTGARIRGRYTLSAFSWRSPQEFVARYAVVVEIEGEPRPALAADWIIMTTLLEQENEHSI